VGRFFEQMPQEGKPISMRGLAKGIRAMAYALEHIAILGGRVDWSSFDAPTLIPYREDGTNEFGELGTPEVKNSLEYDEDGAMQLVGDEDAPTGNPKYYGTNSGGDKGFHAIPASYTDEEAQDAVGAMIADTHTVDLTYTDATPELKADVRKQMSITSDSGGLKLSGDESTPGKTQYYGTDDSDENGAKGYHDLADAVEVVIDAVLVALATTMTNPGHVLGRKVVSGVTTWGWVATASHADQHPT